MTPTAGIVVLIGSGMLGNAGSRLVTDDTTPLASSVVVRLSVAGPVHVAEPVTVAPVVVALVCVLPLHETAGS